MRTKAERPSGDTPADVGARTGNGLRATVLASLTNGMFRLQMKDGSEVVAHAALDLRKAFTRLLPGDPVVIELSPFDHSRARICSLIKSPQHSDRVTQPGRTTSGRATTGRGRHREPEQQEL